VSVLVQVPAESSVIREPRDHEKRWGGCNPKAELAAVSWSHGGEPEGQQTNFRRPRSRRSREQVLNHLVGVHSFGSIRGIWIKDFAGDIGDWTPRIVLNLGGKLPATFGIVQHNVFGLPATVGARLDTDLVQLTPKQLVALDVSICVFFELLLEKLELAQGSLPADDPDSYEKPCGDAPSRVAGATVSRRSGVRTGTRR